MIYWNNTGKYQAEYDKAWSELVPSSGSSEYVEGENLRAATRIYYDYFNNGFGNNLTGAYNWLKNHEFINQSMAYVLGEYANCQVAPRYDNQFTDKDPIVIALELVIDSVIEDIISKNGNFTKHDDDMFNYSEKDDYGSWGDDYE